MSADQLTSLYTEAKNWWEGLDWVEQGKAKNRYFRRAIGLPEMTIGHIKAMYDNEYPAALNNPKEKPEPIIYSELPPVKSNEDILREALEKIANYIPDFEINNGMTGRRVLINLMAIAQIALHETNSENKQG